MPAALVGDKTLQYGNTFKITFYLKRGEEKRGKCPIMSKVRVGDTLSDFSTGLAVKPISGCWAREMSDEAVVNAWLEKVCLLVHIQHDDLSRKYKYNKIEVQYVKTR